jgi:prepilin-type N-terminal cleavage/methylation domain-containing protein
MMRNRKGFTILELLIATLVFSIVLMVIVACVIRFNKAYYKGTVSNTTQIVARNLIDDVVRTIEFNGGDIVPLYSGGNVRGYCIGDSRRYSFYPGDEISGSLFHVLISDTFNGCGPGTPALNMLTMPSNIATAIPPVNNGREQLYTNMRISKFDITEAGGLYTVTVRVAFGSDSAFDFPTAPDAKCKEDTNLTYCAVSELTTTVRKRVNS